MFFNIDLESFQKVLSTEVKCGCMLQGQFCNGRTHDKTLVIKSRFVFGHGSIQEIPIFPAVKIEYGYCHSKPVTSPRGRISFLRGGRV